MKRWGQMSFNVWNLGRGICILKAGWCLVGYSSRLEIQTTWMHSFQGGEDISRLRATQKSGSQSLWRRLSKQHRFQDVAYPRLERKTANITNGGIDHLCFCVLNANGRGREKKGSISGNWSYHVTWSQHLLKKQIYPLAPECVSILLSKNISILSPGQPLL